YCNRQQTFNEIYPMDNNAFIKIATILNDYGYLLAIHTNKGKYSFVDNEAFWNYHYELLTKACHGELPKKTFTTREGYLRDFHYAKNAEEIIDKGIKVLKIDARHKDAYSIQGVREQLNIEHLDISSSFEDNIEITSDTSNKGLLLEKVIRQKGYQKNEVAVFGDGENDAPMLQNFSYSFAPKRASIHALKAASYNLSLTCEDGAVYEGLKILKDMKLI
ncbi:MAG: HAD hydrolase family protein, partial [Erysipelotrichaceae bacterium]|nr:HAD hydrolase family protein [Erysipelotrichaceae bacterium]